MHPPLPDPYKWPQPHSHTPQSPESPESSTHTCPHPRLPRPDPTIQTHLDTLFCPYSFHILLKIPPKPPPPFHARRRPHHPLGHSRTPPDMLRTRSFPPVSSRHSSHKSFPPIFSALDKSIRAFKFTDFSFFFRPFGRKFPPSITNHHKSSTKSPIGPNRISHFGQQLAPKFYI